MWVGGYVFCIWGIWKRSSSCSFSVSPAHLKMARLSDQSTRGLRRLSLGRSLMKCWPPNMSAAYRPQNMNDLLLETTKHNHTIVMSKGESIVPCDQYME